MWPASTAPQLAVASASFDALLILTWCFQLAWQFSLKSAMKTTTKYTVQYGVLATVGLSGPLPPGRSLADLVDCWVLDPGSLVRASLSQGKAGPSCRAPAKVPRTCCPTLQARLQSLRGAQVYRYKTVAGAIRVLWATAATFAVDTLAC